MLFRRGEPEPPTLRSCHHRPLDGRSADSGGGLATRPARRRRHRDRGRGARRPAQRPGEAEAPAQAPGRRGRRRRRVRGPDRRARDRAQGALGDRLEARDRVGGRALNADIGDGEVTERGGTFVGPTQDRILALAEKLGVGTFPTYNEGENVYITSGAAPALLRHRRHRHRAAGPGRSFPTSRSSSAISTTRPPGSRSTRPGRRPEPPSSTRRRSRPTSSRTAPPRSSASWSRSRRGRSSAPSRASSRCSSSSSTSPRRATSATSGTFERNFNTRGGAQESRFVGGSQEICFRVAKGLGRRVILRSPVRRIVQTKRGVTVHSRRVTVKAKRAIVAIPPVLTGRIDYEPGLPSERDRARRAAPPGLPDQGHGRLREAVLARSGPDRPGARHRGADERDLRRLARGRQHGRHLRLHRRRFGPRLLEAPPPGPPRRRRRRARRLLRPRGGEPRALHRDRLDRTRPYSRGCPVAIPAPGA